jgi:hypothetical protein
MTFQEYVIHEMIEQNSIEKLYEIEDNSIDCIVEIDYTTQE